MHEAKSRCPIFFRALAVLATLRNFDFEVIPRFNYRKTLMKNWRHHSITVLALLFVAGSMPEFVVAQGSGTILAGAELSRVVPTGFYFQGLSAQTQMRNAAAARFGTNRYLIAGLVDTTGYAADLRAKYEGFLITDSDITIGGERRGIGAYGFGFTNDGKLNIMDLAGNQLLSVAITKDNALKRPRPLMMSADANHVRLYSGRDYVLIGLK